MPASFSLGFASGLLALAAAEALALLWVFRRLLRKKAAAEGEAADPHERRDLQGERPITLPPTKQGFVWILEPEKVPQVCPEGLPIGSSKDAKSKQNAMDVFPVKKYAKIKGSLLILSGLDGSHATIELLNCTALAVSASSLSSRKWAKRYPIKLERKEMEVYNGSKTCYLYFDTSWEKECWCKALRLASSPSGSQSQWYMQLHKEFQKYLASLNNEYPCFLNPSGLSTVALNRTNSSDGSSKVRLFLKRISKKASSKSVQENKAGSTLGENRIFDKFRASHGGASLPDASSKSTQEEKSSNDSLQILPQPSLPTSTQGYRGRLPIFPNTVSDEKFANDEGTLCWNLLFSRLFFDAKISVEINNSIRSRIQRTLSNMSAPTYIGDITLIGFDLGNLPPYIHNMRVLPVELNELCAFEADFEYSGGIILDIETRLEVREPELQKDILKTSLEADSSGEISSDLLEGIEHYESQLRSSQGMVDKTENKDEVDGSKQLKNSGWASNYKSRWKNILHSIATHVSQVPLSLAIRVTSVRGTLRIHLKPPPSDQLWYGFPLMPDIDWTLEASVAERKITSSHIALLISNRFKAAVRESFVLPNCGSICIPWMLADKDDWVPRNVAPFVWVNQESTDTRGPGATSTQPEENKSVIDDSKKSITVPSAASFIKDEFVKDVIYEEPTEESPAVPSGSQSSSVSSTLLYHHGVDGELRIPLLMADRPRPTSIESRAESPFNSLSRMISATDEHEQSLIAMGDDSGAKKSGRRARMMDFGKRMGDKLEEKRRHLEEKSKHIVEKMRENSRN